MPDFKKLIILIVIISSVVSCGPSDLREIRTLQPCEVVDNFSNEVFISDNISAIIESGNCLYFLDRKLSGVIKTDKEFNLLAVFGKKGRGPGESVYVDAFGISEKYLYVNGNNSCYNLFHSDSANYIKSVSYASELGNPILTSRLCIEDEKILASYRGEYTGKGFPIIEVDTSGSVLAFYEGTVVGENENVKAVTERDFFRTDMGHVSIIKMAPVIDFYDKEMNYKGAVDISYIPIIKEKMQDIESKEHLSGSSITVYKIINDAYYSKGKIYMLCLTVNKDKTDKMQNLCNTIVIMELDNTSCRYVEMIKLQDKYYSSICVTKDNQLFAANPIKSQIEVYCL